MRKYFISGLFILLLASSLVLLPMPPDLDSINRENRNINEMPELSVQNLLSGDFSKGFESYVDDHISFRSELMSVSDNIRARLGYSKEDTGRIILTSADVGVGAEDRRLVVYDDYIMEMFKKNEDAQTKYVEALNEIRTAVPNDIRMYSILVPTALEFCDKYKNDQDSQKEAIEFVSSRLKGIFPVDVYSALEKDSSDSLYFMTDHHWTANGAYAAYKQYMSVSGGNVVDKSEFTRKENGDFYGSLYQKAKSQLIDQKMDTIFYYDVTEKNQFDIKMRAEDNVTEYGVGAPMFDLTKSNYLLFFGSDHPFMEITNTSNPDGKTVLVIKDSYANAFLPWLSASCGKVLVIDPRSYGGNLVEDTEKYGVDEILVLNYVFSPTFADYSDYMKNII